MSEENKQFYYLNNMEKEWIPCESLNSAKSNYVAEVNSQGTISRYWANKEIIEEAAGKKLSNYFGPDNI
nr:hypothetical protein [uncultured Macellibacteroides sp.]